MRQTSEEFASAMVADDEPQSYTSFAEQLAQAEKRLTEKLEESNREFMEKLAGMKLAENVSRETLETEETENESNESTSDENENDNE